MTRAERPAMNSPMASNRRRAQPADTTELQQAAQPDVSMGEEVDEDEDDESAGDFDPYLFMKHLPPKSAACRGKAGTRRIRGCLPMLLENL